MERDEAWNFVCDKIESPRMRQHMLATEACMRAVASRLKQDPDMWAITGLVHDCDIEEVDGDPERHGRRAAEMLAENGLPEVVTHAVMVHPGHGERVSLLDRALWCVDPTTGFIMAAVLVIPSKKFADLKLKSIRKRMKDKRFAASVSRDQIRGCSEIGLELDEFLGICLEAMRDIAPQLGH